MVSEITYPSFTVKYNSNTKSIQSGSSILIPYGVTVTITASDVEGYTTPSQISFTTSTSSIIQNMIYEEISVIVKIMNSSGILIDVNSWTGGSNATGVYVNDGNQAVVIAPTDWITYRYRKSTPREDSDDLWNGRVSAWGAANYKLPGTFSYTDGKANTDIIMGQISNMVSGDVSSTYPSVGISTITGCPVAEYCRAYSRGCKGAGQWYLPARDELNIIIDNVDAINEALDKISGEPIISLSDGGLWSSTQASDAKAYYLYFSSDTELTISTNNKDRDFQGCRPFCKP